MHVSPAWTRGALKHVGYVWMIPEDQGFMIIPVVVSIYKLHNAISRSKGFTPGSWLWVIVKGTSLWLLVVSLFFVVTIVFIDNVSFSFLHVSAVHHDSSCHGSQDIQYGLKLPTNALKLVEIHSCFLLPTSPFAPSKFQRSMSVSKPISSSINFQMWFQQLSVRCPIHFQFSNFYSQVTCPCRSPNFAKVRIKIILYLFHLQILCSIAVSFWVSMRSKIHFQFQSSVYSF